MKQLQKDFLGHLNEVIDRYSKNPEFSYVDALGCLKLMSDELSSKARSPFNFDDDGFRGPREVA